MYVYIYYFIFFMRLQICKIIYKWDKKRTPNTIKDRLKSIGTINLKATQNVDLFVKDFFYDEKDA